MVSTRKKRKNEDKEQRVQAVELVSPSFVIGAPKVMMSEEIKKMKKLMLIIQVGTTHWVNTSVGKRTCIFVISCCFRTGRHY